MELDYSLTTPEERVAYTKKLLKDTPPPYNNNTLKILADYILFTHDRNQTKKERTKTYPILTPNRELTIDKRQVSYEGLAEKLENGEDGLYNLIRIDKGQILDPKDPITEEDIDTIPGIKECMDVIASLKNQLETASKYQRKQLNQAIIDTWKQAYLIKGSFHQIGRIKSTSQIKTLASIPIPEEDLHSDMHWHLIDLENLASKALEHKHPLLWWLLVYKVDGLTNEEIQEKLYDQFGEWHSEQYYSTTWRKRIPKLISEQYAKDYVIWYYTYVEKGYWKKCSKCGRVKLGHPLFYAKNSSKDRWYSQCKQCKNEGRKNRK